MFGLRGRHAILALRHAWDRLAVVHTSERKYAGLL